MAILSRAQLDEIKLRIEELNVPEWGGSVLIREMTGTDRDAYEASVWGSKAPQKGRDRDLNLANARARCVALCLIDENGQRLYKDNEVYLLGKLPAAGLDRVFDRCRELSGITDADNKAIEQVLKNSQNDQNDVSGLDLHLQLEVPQ